MTGTTASSSRHSSTCTEARTTAGARVLEFARKALGTLPFVDVDGLTLSR